MVPAFTVGGGCCLFCVCFRVLVKWLLLGCVSLFCIDNAFCLLGLGVSLFVCGSLFYRVDNGYTFCCVGFCVLGVSLFVCGVCRFGW